MVNSKKVSVIIPCFSQAEYLDESIKSVLSQTYPNFEIIVVDDGSPDNVEEVTRKYPQVKLIQQSNLGAALARNRGIQESLGSYLIFLDADDRLLPNALQEGVDFLSEKEDFAFVTGLVQLIDAKGELVRIPEQPKIEKDHYQELLRSNYIWTPGVVMYRKAVFIKHAGFESKAMGSADYELNLRLARTFSVGCHGKVILEYRQHEANMSRNLAYMLRSGVSVRRAEFKYLKGNPKLISAWKEGIRIVQEDLGNRLIMQVVGKRKTNLKEFWYLIKYYPRGISLLMQEFDVLPSWFWRKQS